VRFDVRGRVPYDEKRVIGSSVVAQSASFLTSDQLLTASY